MFLRFLSWQEGDYWCLLKPNSLYQQKDRDGQNGDINYESSPWKTTAISKPDGNTVSPALQMLYQRHIISLCHFRRGAHLLRSLLKSKTGAETVASSCAALFISVDRPPTPPIAASLTRKHQMLGMLKWERYWRDWRCLFKHASSESPTVTHFFQTQTVKFKSALKLFFWFITAVRPMGPLESDLNAWDKRGWWSTPCWQVLDLSHTTSKT